METSHSIKNMSLKGDSMNSFTRSGSIKKIIIAIIFIILFNWIYPCIPVYAEDTDTTTEEEAPFGVLLEPLMGLVSGLGEGIIWLIQSSILNIPVSSVYIDVNKGIFSFSIGDLEINVNEGGLAGGLTGLAIGGPFGGVAGFFIGNTAAGAVEDWFGDKNFYLPLYAISPFEIFSGVIPALDVNFINPDSGLLSTIKSVFTGESTAKALSPQISKWYVALRNLVLVGLMIVLLYIGIRIVLSSAAEEKAKYKEHIKDWLIAVILVVFMHYIMAFALTATEYITYALAKENGYMEFTFSDENAQKIKEQTGIELDGNVYRTNFMGYARLKAQANVSSGGQFTFNNIGYTIVFLVLVVYTVMFLIIYLKRVIYMAFLTMIAPLVALTYPIDKISDGQAQAFNMWLKEYVYNLLLQPFHLLLYTMLIGSAMELASSNMIYTLVALGFLMPAEKLLRRFFGFDQKAPEAGSIVGGVVGGSMAMSAINSMRRIGSVSKRNNSSNNNEVSGESNNSKTRLAETNRKPESDKKVSIEELMQGDDNEPPASGNLRLAETSGEGQNRTQTNGQTPRGIYETGKTDSGILLASNMRPPLEMNNSSSSESSAERPATSENETNNIRMKPGPLVEARRIASKVKNSTPIKIAGAVTGTAGHYVAKVGRKVPRVMTKAGLGIALGTAGVAAGIATGDWSNIAAYGATAAGVGASVGEGVSNIASNVTSGAKTLPSGIRDQYEARRYTKAEREKIQNERSDKEWRRSKEIQKMYKDEFGTEVDENGVENWKKAMEMAQKEFRPYGITNDKATIKRIKAIGLDGKVTKQDIATAKASSSIKTEEELKGFSDRLRKNGVAESKIKKLENDLRRDNVSGNFT